MDMGLERTGLTYDEEGNASYSYKPKSPVDIYDPKTIKKAMIFPKFAEEVGTEYGVEKPAPMRASVQQGQFPIASLMGQEIPATGMDYGRTVQKALKQQFAPDDAQDTIVRDYLGIPQPKADVPPEFTTDVEELKRISGGNQELFVAGLERLASKYTNDPEALQRIKLIRSIFSGESPFVPDNTLMQ